MVKIRLKGIYLYLFITVVKVRGDEQIYELKSIGPRCLYVCYSTTIKNRWGAVHINRGNKKEVIILDIGISWDRLT